jgi:hypothetical protein
MTRLAVTRVDRASSTTRSARWCPSGIVVCSAGELLVAQITAEFGVTYPTIYRHLDQLDGLDSAP